MHNALPLHISKNITRFVDRGQTSFARLSSSFIRKTSSAAGVKVGGRSSRVATATRSKSKSPQTTRAAFDMLGNLTSMLKPSPKVTYFEDNAPQWAELERLVNEKLSRNGLPVDMDDSLLENGPPSPAALRRTFGLSNDAEPRVILYRDHAAWCPYCHKVVLQLEEKKIPYIVKKINMRCYGDKPPEFLAKVPSGLLPVLEIDGQIVTESAVIQSLLEEVYPEPALLPPSETVARARAMSLMRLERRLFGDWLQWLCNSWGAEKNQMAFIETMDVVEAELGKESGPYFLDKFSLVDIIFAPFLERIAASILYYKGFIVRGGGRWPNLERWFAAMETREPYLAFKSDYYTHCHDLPPQLGGCVSTPESKEFAAAIDGTDGKSWKLPLQPLSSTSLEPHSPGENPAIDRLFAARKLLSNHEAVTRFALRGPGRPGARPVSAPLSDPTAIPAMEHFEEVDAALRCVVYALLHDGGGEACSGPVIVEEPGPSRFSAGPVVAALEYLRDRVGVPRDLAFPAARQLRAHLNWMIDHLVV